MVNFVPVNVSANSRFTVPKPGELKVANVAYSDNNKKFECVARNTKGMVHSKHAYLQVKGNVTFTISTHI